MWGDHQALLEHFTTPLANGCWEFTGYVLPQGYGQLGRNLLAHRIAWEVANEQPVPDGLVIDHQCHNRDPICNDNHDCAHRRCVNPDHLEAVPSRVNILRGKGFGPINAEVTHCPAGHPYDDMNTYHRPTGRLGRQCRTCRREAGRRFGEVHRAEINDIRAAERRAANPVDFAIREWAMSVGLPCSMHGPISRAVRTAYADACRLARAG